MAETFPQRLTEHEHRTKMIELLDKMDQHRMDLWIYSGILAGALDSDLVQRVMTEELEYRSHEVQEFWTGVCNCHAEEQNLNWCTCSANAAQCPYHGMVPVLHDTYEEHCKMRLSSAGYHSGGRCKLCDHEAYDQNPNRESYLHLDGRICFRRRMHRTVSPWIIEQLERLAPGVALMPEDNQRPAMPCSRAHAMSAHLASQARP